MRAISCDASGCHLIRVELKAGDEVIYKRNGTAGAFRGVVLDIGKRVKIELRSHDGTPLFPAAVRYVNPRFLAVYRDGLRVVE